MGAIIAFGAVVVFVFVWHYRGGGVASFVAALAACALPTFDLTSFGYSTVGTAIAPSTVVITTFHLALIGGVLALPAQTFRNMSPWFFLFLASMVAFVLVRGLTAPHTVSGVLQWVSAVVAWGVGGAVMETALRKGKPTERVVAIGVGIVIGWHAVATALQLAGFRAVNSIEVGNLEVARASGIAGHSGNLGKIMFFLILILLPISLSSDRAARRWAIAGITTAAVLTGLSFSRANAVAVIALVGLWLLLGPGITAAKRLIIPVIGLLAALPVLEILIARNEYDPEGGARPVLLATALRQISDSFWLGVGPNNYLNVVGQYDPLAAGGLPVHSAFLLTLAELGLIGLALIMVPLILVLLRALRAMKRGASSRIYAVALVCAAPGVAVIATTGWGVLREQYLVLMFFALGYLAGGMRWSHPDFSDGVRTVEIGRAPVRPGVRHDQAQGGVDAARSFSSLGPRP